jgi:3-phenylpropionate/trans-cinnamate dioxygenase ferredoxin subunit
MSWHNATTVDEIAVGDKKCVTVADEKILLFHLEDCYFATQNSCTHMFIPLSKGKIVDGCRIQCPFHRARFDIRTGEVIDWANFPPGIQVMNVVRGEKSLKTYETRIEGDQVQVKIG